jgi:hypothetical protein
VCCKRFPSHLRVNRQAAAYRVARGNFPNARSFRHCICVRACAAASDCSSSPLRQLHTW